MPVIPLLGSPEGDAESVSHLLEGFLPLLGFNHVGGAPFPLFITDVHDGITHLLLPFLLLLSRPFYRALERRREANEDDLF